jgi:hypothetical protein
MKKVLGTAMVFLGLTGMVGFIAPINCDAAAAVGIIGLMILFPVLIVIWENSDE